MLVLIAEEEDEAREKLVAAARASGHLAIAVADIREAETVIVRRAIQVVIADLLVISLAALEHPTATRVLVTSVPNMLTPEELTQFGISRVILKPIERLDVLPFDEP
jgi:DNA-binding response OmpR family regulator